MSGLFTSETLKKGLLPQNSNLVNFSVLNEFYSAKPFRSFSIKYVVQGTELYSVNGKKYNVNSNQYLIANKHSEGFVVVDSKKAVTGICIDVTPGIISEVVGSYLRPDTNEADPGLDTFFNSSDFLENKYNASGTNVGSFLMNLKCEIEEKVKTSHAYSKEFYFVLAEKIITDYIPVFKQFHSVKAIKRETKKELLRKLIVGKMMIEENFLKPLMIENIARESGISEYHFFRLFRSAFGISPHQYLVKLRLDHGHKLLKDRSLSVGSIAHLCGFADSQSFSKSFKKQFGINPSSCF